VSRRLTERPQGAPELRRSVEQLTELVGRVKLKELVRETTDLVERLCIEAALELTKDNRASAADVLGLSRQSLYSKLHRFGLVGSGDIEN
jgi:DNA-binding NtrC family response regulator